MTVGETVLTILIAVAAIAAAGVLQVGKFMRRSGRKDHWSNRWTTHIICTAILIACMVGIRYLWS